MALTTCPDCNHQVSSEAQTCPACGRPMQAAAPAAAAPAAPAPGVASAAKARWLYIVLGIFLGCFGVHNFYAGRTKPAAIQLALSLLLGWVFGLGFLIAWVWVIVELFTVTQDGKGVPFD